MWRFRGLGLNGQSQQEHNHESGEHRENLFIKLLIEYAESPEVSPLED
ncbi:hypothetical protein PM8797T_28654 [Gimesia maris DSM 8797]|nr:hypothetical protein PM8797T_28654 [Gimesia maris DSM 8797]